MRPFNSGDDRGEVGDLMFKHVDRITTLIHTFINNEKTSRPESARQSVISKTPPQKITVKQKEGFKFKVLTIAQLIENRFSSFFLTKMLPFD